MNSKEEIELVGYDIPINDFFHFSLDSVSKKWTSWLPIFDVNSQTHLIDWANRNSHIDPVIADGCVVVMTNDGRVGTLSHLTTDNNPELFARHLREFTGPGRIPVCLAGGSSDVRKSPELARKLKEHLHKRGFLVGNSPLIHVDLLGCYLRQSTISCEGVKVKRMEIGGERKCEIKTLRFPQL